MSLGRGGGTVGAVVSHSILACPHIVSVIGALIYWCGEQFWYRTWYRKGQRSRWSINNRAPKGFGSFTKIALGQCGAMLQSTPSYGANRESKSSEQKLQLPMFDTRSHNDLIPQSRSKRKTTLRFFQSDRCSRVRNCVPLPVSCLRGPIPSLMS